MINQKTELYKAIRNTAMAFTLTVSSVSFAGNNSQYETNSQLKDAWIDGKVETALLVNRHLNNFTINTDVTNGEVQLEGTVRSEVDRQLAIEIAKGVSGVNKVSDQLTIKSDASAQATTSEERSFGEWYDDSTTTAAVKSKLIWNSETSGLDINVDTNKGVVTLQGEVSSSAEKDLIEQIAANTDGVRDIDNHIEVAENS